MPNKSNRSCPILIYLTPNQRFALSNILSFLSETEGTSLLITNKSWTRKILPLFQLPENHPLVLLDQLPISPSNDKKKNGSTKRKLKKVRHEFIVMPIQDSNVLLAKLNTKRLHARIKKYKHKQHSIGSTTETSEEAAPSTNYDSLLGLKNYNRNGNYNKNGYHYSQNRVRVYYPINMTTEEIAWHEWIQSRSDFMTYQNLTSAATDTFSENSIAGATTKTTNRSNFSFQNTNGQEAKLELLRYRSPPSQPCKNNNHTPNHTNLPYPSHLSLTKLLPLPQLSLLPPPPKLKTQPILLTSYPRSGNTLLRNLLERITNIITGSDTRPDRTLSKSLALDHDLIGEGITNPIQTPIIKTHYPERIGYTKYDTNRVILLVRNPYDAIDSYWNMCCTNTHTESVVEDVYNLYTEKFNGLVKSEIGTWLEFVKFWLDHCETSFCDDKKGIQKKRPSLLVIRFEDLILQTEHVMEQIVKYILVQNDDDDQSDGNDRDLHPFWKWRIRHGLDLTGSFDHDDCKSSSSSSTTTGTDDNNNINKNNETNQKNVDTLNLGSYKPRSEKKSSHASIGKSLRKSRYSQDILSHIQEMSQMDEYQMSIINDYDGGTTNNDLDKKKNVTKLNILELFGYDIKTQNFPLNFDNSQEEGAANKHWSFDHHLHPNNNGAKGNHSKDDDCNITPIRVNAGSELRSSLSPYGRAMTRWRKSQTCNDTKPFPTVQK